MLTLQKMLHNCVARVELRQCIIEQKEHLFDLQQKLNKLILAAYGKRFE